MRDPANTEIPRDLKFVVPQIPRLNSGCGIGSPNTYIFQSSKYYSLLLIIHTYNTKQSNTTIQTVIYMLLFSYEKINIYIQTNSFS